MGADSVSMLEVWDNFIPCVFCRPHYDAVQAGTLDTIHLCRGCGDTYSAHVRRHYQKRVEKAEAVLKLEQELLWFEEAMGL